MPSSTLTRNPTIALERLASVLGHHPELHYGKAEWTDHKPLWTAPEWGVEHFHVTLKGIRGVIPFATGGTTDVCAGDALVAILRDETDETFEDWCNDFGYDTDSRKAEATWTICHDILPDLVADIFGAYVDQAREIAYNA